MPMTIPPPHRPPSTLAVFLVVAFAPIPASFTPIPHLADVQCAASTRCASWMPVPVVDTTIVNASDGSCLHGHTSVNTSTTEVAWNVLGGPLQICPALNGCGVTNYACRCTTKVEATGGVVASLEEVARTALKGRLRRWGWALLICVTTCTGVFFLDRNCSRGGGGSDSACGKCIASEKCFSAVGAILWITFLAYGYTNDPQLAPYFVGCGSANASVGAFAEALAAQGRPNPLGKEKLQQSATKPSLPHAGGAEGAGESDAVGESFGEDVDVVQPSFEPVGEAFGEVGHGEDIDVVQSSTNTGTYACRLHHTFCTTAIAATAPSTIASTLGDGACPWIEATPVNAEAVYPPALFQQRLLAMRSFWWLVAGIVLVVLGVLKGACSRYGADDYELDDAINMCYVVFVFVPALIVIVCGTLVLRFDKLHFYLDDYADNATYPQCAQLRLDRMLGLAYTADSAITTRVAVASVALLIANPALTKPGRLLALCNCNARDTNSFAGSYKRYMETEI